MRGGIVVGIDGGTTKTDCVVSDLTGHILGYDSCGCTAYGQIGIEEAMKRLHKVVVEALKLAGNKLENVVSAVCSLNGMDTTEDRAKLEAPLRNIFSKNKLLLVNDAIGGLWGGTRHSPAIYIGAGSGFTSAYRKTFGKEKTLYHLGGNIDIRSLIIKSAIFAADGRGPYTILAEYMMKAMNVKRLKKLPEAIFIHHAPDKMNLSKMLFSAHKKGDKIASEILVQIAEDHANTASALLRQMGVNSSSPADAIFGGGFYYNTGCRLLMETVSAGVHCKFPGVRICLPEFKPVVGALLCALFIAGHKAYKDVNQISETIPSEMILYWQYSSENAWHQIKPIRIEGGLENGKT